MVQRGTVEFMEFDAEEIRVKYKRSERRKAVKEGRARGISVADVEKALIAYKGNVTEAAKHLGYTSPHQLRQRIGKSARLRKLADELIERVTDLAESKVVNQIETGNLTAAIFWLKTRGKDRGYTEKTTTEHELGPQARKDAAALIEAMRNGAKAIDDAVDVKDYTTWVEEPPLLEEK